MNSDRQDDRKQPRSPNVQNQQQRNEGQLQSSSQKPNKGLFKPRRPFENGDEAVDKRLFVSHQLEEAEQTIVAGVTPMHKPGALPSAKPTNVQMRRPDIPVKRPDPQKISSRTKVRKPVRLTKVAPGTTPPQGRPAAGDMPRQPRQKEQMPGEVQRARLAELHEVIPDSSIEENYGRSAGNLNENPKRDFRREAPDERSRQPMRPARRESHPQERPSPQGYREPPQDMPGRTIRRSPAEGQQREQRREPQREQRRESHDSDQERRRRPQRKPELEEYPVEIVYRDVMEEDIPPDNQRRQSYPQDFERREDQRSAHEHEHESEPEYKEIPQEQFYDEEFEEEEAYREPPPRQDARSRKEPQRREPVRQEAPPERSAPPRGEPRKVKFREASRQEPTAAPKPKPPQYSEQHPRMRKPPPAKAPVPMKRPPRVDPAEEALRKKAVPYEWGKTDRFSQDQKKFLERVSKQFAENFTTKLAPLLQTRVNIEYQGARLRPYSVLLQSLYEPISLVVLRMDPETKGLIVIDFPLSFAFIDRCLGGIGQSMEEIRYFTEIEVAILERVVARLIESYQESWGEIKECKPQYLNMEFNPQTVHIVKPSESMVCISFDVRVAQASGPVYVVMPFEYLKTVLPKSNFEEFMLTRTSPQIGPSVAPLFAKNLDAAMVPLSVELGSTELLFGELVVLEVGDFVKLDSEITAPLKVKVNEKNKFLGRPGLRDRKVSVQITRVLQEGDEEFDE